MLDHAQPPALDPQIRQLPGQRTPVLASRAEHLWGLEEQLSVELDTTSWPTYKDQIFEAYSTHNTAMGRVRCKLSRMAVDNPEKSATIWNFWRSMLEMFEVGETQIALEVLIDNLDDADLDTSLLQDDPPQSLAAQPAPR